MPSFVHDVLHRLLRLGRQRDGESRLLEWQALQLDASTAVGAGMGAAAESVPRRRPLARPPQRLLQEQIAAKLLHAWLQNRRQTLFPLALNLRNVAAAGQPLLVQLAAASTGMANAGTASAGTAALRARLPAVLERIGAGPAGQLALRQALAEPPALPALLQALAEAGLGAHAYAAALLVAGRSGRLEQAWLDYLAARFALPAEVRSELERRGGARRVRL